MYNRNVVMKWRFTTIYIPKRYKGAWRVKALRVNLQNNFVLLTFVVVSVSLFITDFLIEKTLIDSTYEDMYEEAMEIADISASNPVVIDALLGKGDQKKLQQLTTRVSDISTVRYITVMDMNRLRLTHPNPMMIGTYYEEKDADPAFNGERQTSYGAGSLGKSLRAFSPVYAEDGRQVGVVLAGVMDDEVEKAMERSRSMVTVGSGSGLLIGIIGAILLARRIKKVTFGLEPFAIAKMLEERNAIFAALHEGTIAIDRQSQITIINKAAQHILQEAGLCGEFIGRNVNEVMPGSAMDEVLSTGKAVLNQEQVVYNVTILTNCIPVCVNREIVGVVATFRDKNEMQRLAEKLIDVKNYAETLRAQTHEFMNKLQVIVGMIQLKSFDQVCLYVQQISQTYHMEIGSVVSSIKDPVIAGFLLGKMSWAREHHVDMKLVGDSYIEDFHDSDTVHDIITILGTLLNNAIESVEKSELKIVTILLQDNAGHLHVEVTDTGSGIQPALYKKIYEKGYSTKGDKRGIGFFLVQQVLARLQGRITFSSEVAQGTTFYVDIPQIKQE